MSAACRANTNNFTRAALCFSFRLRICGAVGILSPARHFESLSRGDAELVIAGLHRNTQDTTLSVAQAVPERPKSKPRSFLPLLRCRETELGCLGRLNLGQASWIGTDPSRLFLTLAIEQSVTVRVSLPHHHLRVFSLRLFEGPNPAQGLQSPALRYFSALSLSSSLLVCFLGRSNHETKSLRNVAVSISYLGLGSCSLERAVMTIPRFGHSPSSPSGLNLQD